MATDRPVALWDLPTRLFHWASVLALPLACWSAEAGWHTVHLWTGYSVLVMVVTRLIWGFVGSRHSRFSDFMAGSTQVVAYLRGHGTAIVGHNPLGGWSVLAMLSLMLAQAISGLFNSDELMFSGPLYYSVGDDLRALMGQIHGIAFYLLLALAGLHLVAITYYQLWRGQRLIAAMWRGSAPGREGLAPPVSTLRALIIVALVAVALWWALQLAPQPAALVW